MKKKLFIEAMILAIMVSCSSSKPAKTNPDQRVNPSTTKTAPAIPTPSIEAKQLANEQQTTFVTEFSFKKGSEELTPFSKQKLKELSSNAMKKGKIEMVKVISWADQEYPSVKQKRLSDEQQELANKRNRQIKNYIDSIVAEKEEKPDVELISMAKRPTAFNSLISADDARIKKSLETAGIPTSESKSKASAKSSRAIVIIKLEEPEKR